MQLYAQTQPSCCPTFSPTHPLLCSLCHLSLSDRPITQTYKDTRARKVHYYEQELMPHDSHDDDDEHLTEHTTHWEENTKMDDIDTMFSHLLEEMDGLSQSLAQSVVSNPELSTGRSDLNESLNDLDGYVGDIFVADPSTQPEEKESPTAPLGPPAAPPLPSSTYVRAAYQVTQTLDPDAENVPPAPKLTMLQTVNHEQPHNMIVKVLMADGSSKTLIVEATQTVKDVLDKLFEKTYCDCSTDWSLCETNPELSIERILEDHEYLAESVSAWTNSTENKIYFLQRPRKHVMFKQPQFFYMWKKSCLKVVTEQEKQLLLKENFEGLSVVVPDLEGWLYLKDDGRKVWKPRYFVLRASGLYYVPKGKTRSSSDLACFIRFEQVNVYWTDSYRLKYRAPTDHCFVLKHPCIQKESHYVKFLCCEDEDSALLWVNSIRIAKYGTALYESYKSAVKRALNPPDLSTNGADTPRSANVHAPDQDQCTEAQEDEGPPDFIPPPPPGYMAIL